MRRYDYLLFDADGTLFDFNQNEYTALKHTFEDFGMTFGDSYDEIAAAYHKFNDDLWKELELGRVKKEELLILRFTRLFERFGLGSVPDTFNPTYIRHLSQGAELIGNARDVCRRLCEAGYYMVIITNGVEAVQTDRFARSGLTPYFKQIFISERVGCNKPSREFFDRVYAAIDGFDRTRALIIGDSLTSDIRGGNNAETDTCWFNPDGAVNTTDARPTYEIRHLDEVAALADSSSAIN